MRCRRMRVRRPRARRLGPFSANRMVPNILTLLALCAGMTAIRFAVKGQFEYAVFSIIAAGIFDGLDGRLARLLKATSSFGAELDSLSDFISFGAAPAVMLYLWTMSGLQSIGWAMVLFYAVCCACAWRASTPSSPPSRRRGGRIFQRRAGAGRRRVDHAADVRQLRMGRLDRALAVS